MNKGKVTDINEMKFENERQKQAAIKIVDIIKESGKTQKEFAELLQVSLATLTNTFRPAYNQVPSIKLIRKIAEQTDDPKKTYNELMGIAHPDDYEPYEPSDAELPQNKALIEAQKSNRDSRIIFGFLKRIEEIAPNPKLDYNHLTVRGFPRYASVDYSSSNVPIDAWNIQFNTGSKHGFPLSSIQEFFYDILKDGRKNTKYSYVTSSEAAYDELMSVKADIIADVYISVILYKNDEFTETYLTSNHTELDKAGLSL